MGCTQGHTAGTLSTWSRPLAEHSDSVTRTQQYLRGKKEKRRVPEVHQELGEQAEGPGLAPRCAAATNGDAGRCEQKTQTSPPHPYRGQFSGGLAARRPRRHPGRTLQWGQHATTR